MGSWIRMKQEGRRTTPCHIAFVLTARSARLIRSLASGGRLIDGSLCSCKYRSWTCIVSLRISSCFL